MPPSAAQGCQTFQIALLGLMPTHRAAQGSHLMYCAAELQGNSMTLRLQGGVCTPHARSLQETLCKHCTTGTIQLLLAAQNGIRPDLHHTTIKHRPIQAMMHLKFIADLSIGPDPAHSDFTSCLDHHWCTANCQRPGAHCRPEGCSTAHERALRAEIETVSCLSRRELLLIRCDGPALADERLTK